MLMISDAVPSGSAYESLAARHTIADEINSEILALQALMGTRRYTVNPPNDMAKTPSLRLSKDLDPLALMITRARCITGGPGCLLAYGGVCHE
jgi:hypothetical protein